MGQLSRPPYPPPQTEIDRRIAAGARTREEAWPEFYAWKNARERYWLVMRVGLLVGATLLLFVILLEWWFHL